MNRVLSCVIVAAMTIGLLAACGGGGGSSQLAGIDRLGVSSGTVTGFGSVFVNGVEFETDNALFTIDGAPGIESDLNIGQVVTITGTIDANGSTGTATSVVFDADIEGPVTSIDLADSSFIVLGQTVRIDGDTSFDSQISPASVAGLAVGEVVEVSGFVDGSQGIRATYIERKNAGSEFELQGVVSSLDSAASTFQINGFIVDFTSAMLDGFPSGMISNGDYVEAKGTSFGPAGELIASEVSFEDQGIPGSEGDEVEIEGFITRFVSATDFDVSGVPVTTNGQTEYKSGTSASLALDVKVEVEGTLSGSGVVVAEDVEFRPNAEIRVTALVDSVDSAANSLTMLGVAIRVNLLTRFEDDSDAEIAQFSLANVNAGDYLVVRGTEDTAGNADVLATLLEREDVPSPPVETSVQGFVTGVDNPAFTVLGVTIETNAGTEFSDQDGQSLTSAEFFGSAVSVNTLIKASGVESDGPTIVADEVEIED